jgi:hypothetical protein
MYHSNLGAYEIDPGSIYTKFRIFFRFPLLIIRKTDFRTERPRVIF